MGVYARVRVRRCLRLIVEGYRHVVLVCHSLFAVEVLITVVILRVGVDSFAMTEEQFLLCTSVHAL